MPDGFRIAFERSGGLAGAVLRAEVDSSELDPAEARELERLLERVDLSALRRRAGGGADRFQYELAVERGGERTHVTFGETDVTPELRPLLERLLERARGSR